jgi:hypothetical protein
MIFQLFATGGNQSSPDNLKNHYDDCICQIPHSRKSPVNAVTQIPLRISS